MNTSGSLLFWVILDVQVLGFWVVFEVVHLFEQRCIELLDLNNLLLVFCRRRIFIFGHELFTQVNADAKSGDISARKLIHLLFIVLASYHIGAELYESVLGSIVVVCLLLLSVEDSL